MIRYKHVDKRHPICASDCPEDIPRRMIVFWKSRYLLGADKAVVAYDNGELIGFFRYDLSRAYRGKRLWAHGTYVLPAYRKQGVARKLWERAIRRVKPKSINVYTTSRGGEKLTKCLSEKFKKINWYIDK